ncbi:MAG: CHAP domain-containing protein [Clostridia bacterium]|nr:CHAP domain-containing protein [Clostridia bacterium]MBQ4604716.1 CHAP domain-containing protein [Clostridia bacterium]
MNLKRAAIAVLCAVVFFVSGAAPKAFADWYDDIKSGYSVKIVGQNFVADTFCGVNAYYNETGNSVYHCGELVERFYREAYGLDVEIRSTEPRLRMNTPGYKLINPKNAKPGDVVFVSAEMRGTYDHWAIVKYCEDGYLVLFEQNVVYNGTAGVERRLKYPSDSYVIFSPVSEGEKPAPVLKNAGGESVMTSTTERQSEITKEETTKVITTAKPTTTKAVTTTKPTTTKITTTAKPVTTKAETTRQTTKAATTKIPTTAKPSTTAAETTAVTTTLEETTAPFVTYTTERQTETPVNQYLDYTEESSKKNEEKNKATLPLASACGVSASGVAVLAVLLVKKNKNEE